MTRSPIHEWTCDLCGVMRRTTTCDHPEGWRQFKLYEHDDVTNTAITKQVLARWQFHCCPRCVVPHTPKRGLLRQVLAWLNLLPKET